jgi:hypothetical protein
VDVWDIKKRKLVDQLKRRGFGFCKSALAGKRGEYILSGDIRTQ